MIYYTLRKVKDAWSLFVLLPHGGSLTGSFADWHQALACVLQLMPHAVEVSEAEMWRETMRRELAVAHV